MAKNASTGCENSIQTQLTILPKPIAIFTTTPKDSATIDLPHFTVKNNSTIYPWEWLDYQWNFNLLGRANLSILSEPQIFYPDTVETYTVQLAANSSHNCADTFYKNLFVIKKEINHSNTIKKEPFTVTNKFKILNNTETFKMIQIFKTYGRLIFQSTQNNGIEVPAGVYHFQFSGTSANGELVNYRGKKIVLNE